jgi:hypothetical protein
MTVDLTLTNTFLGVIAFAYALQALAIVGTLIGGFLLYRRVTQLIAGIEARHIAPAAAKVNGILDDVKTVSATVRTRTGHVDGIFDWIAAIIERKRRRAA